MRPHFGAKLWATVTIALAVASSSSSAKGIEPAPTAADVHYGPHERQVLDFWKAESAKPTPVVVFIHGGGFVAGSKAKVSPAAIQKCLERGVSFAAINYRYRTEVPIQTVLRDCARAVQFIRSKAGEWNVDKARIASFGGSAGAGSSLWLAFHDDLADPKSDDPVLRESSRISAAASTAGQMSYDILRWHELFGKETVERYGDKDGAPGFYGLKTFEELEGEEGCKLRADCDMLGLIDKNDPPVWLGANAMEWPPKNKGELNHHPKHSEAIKKRCDECGVVAELHVGRRKSDGDDNVTFLLKHLVVEK